MLTADNERFSNSQGGTVYRISSVTVYYELEPKQLKMKYEMDRFFFKRRGSFIKKIAVGNFAMMVEQYRKAVFEATGVKVGAYQAKTAEEKPKRFDATA